MKPTLNPIQTFLKELDETQITDSDFRRIAMNRVNFDLSTPLLKHFIECDEKGEPIEEPEIYSQWLREKDDDLETETIIKQCYEFQQAQKQVLFEGWEIKILENPVIITDGFFEIEFWNYSNRNIEIVLTDFSQENPKRENIKSYSDLTKYQLQTNNNFKELIYGK